MEEKIKQFLTELGYSTDLLDEQQKNRVTDWLEWYKGKTKYHDYYIYNGKQKVKKTLKSLNIATQACGDLSDFFFNEKLDITIDKEDINNQIQEILTQNGFIYNSNRLMQLVKALGTGAYVAYLENGELKINYLNATNILILESDGQDVKSVLFYSEKKVIGGTELTINAHILTETGYRIENRKFIRNDNATAYSEIELDPEIRSIDTKSFIPRFAMLFTPDVNNIDINSPYGISCYANAEDTILSIDSSYDSLDNEISSGKKRIYIKGGAVSFNTDENGKMTPVFDNSDTTFYQVPGDENDPLITESQGELRIDSITEALQANINLFTSKVGLGHNYYKFKDGRAYVNTDNVISSNSDVYRKIKKQENVIQKAIEELIYAIAELIEVPEEKFTISIDFDDSIIEDKQQQVNVAMSEYNAQLISKAEYYRQVYKLKDDAAVKFAEKINEEIKNETIVETDEPEPDDME